MKQRFQAHSQPELHPRKTLRLEPSETCLDSGTIEPLKY